MKYNSQFDSLELLTPLNMKILLLLYDTSHTKSEIYREVTVNNKTCVRSLDKLRELGYIRGGGTRNDVMRLTVIGVSLTEWLLEGAMLIGGVSGSDTN